MTLEELECVPFYSWQCISLQLDHRHVDLVIRNEEDMNKFLKFIIFEMQTLNGTRGSAISLINALNK